MTKAEEYRDRAAATLELAQRQGAGAERNRLVSLAEGWLDLAERVARSPVERLRRVFPARPETE